MFRALRPYQYVVDAVLAVLYFFVGLIFLDLSQPYSGATGTAIIAGYAAAIGVRRSSPGLALGIAWVFSFAQMGLGLYPNVYNIATLLVLYTTSAYGGRIIRWVGLASVGAGSIVAALYLTLIGSGLGVSETLFGWSDLPRFVLQFGLLAGALITALGLPWLLGLLVRAVIKTRESSAARGKAEQVVVVEQERNRIARDMHDVVAHSLAVVIAQADGARYVRASNPEAVDEALTAISTTARDALADVRLLLAQLRHSQGVGPQPMLEDLDRLLDQLRASGLDVAFEQSGEIRPLATGQQLAVYRIVQEALTNALRHGDVAVPVSLSVNWLPESVDLEIINAVEPSRATKEIHTGHGLAGMNERAALVGGWLTAEFVGIRFVVTATVPTTDPPTREVPVQQASELTA